MSDCIVCHEPAKKIVVHISRRTRDVLQRLPMCDEHIQAEITMGASNLSMVDFDLEPLPTVNAGVEEL